MLDLKEMRSRVMAELKAAMKDLTYVEVASFDLQKNEIALMLTEAEYHVCEAKRILAEYYGVKC